jgi:pSer/pThr/pTyr-binding forkhead associated (FHA) protein
MKIRLLSRTPAMSEESTVLAKLPAVLGRNPDADVRLDDSWASRAHCEISEISGTLLVRDLESRNGTLVNGQYVTEAHLLPGDRLTVGLTSFEIQYRRRRRKWLRYLADRWRSEGRLCRAER